MAKKSDNPTNALINRNFIIRVLENPKENDVKKTKLTSANKLSNYLNDEEIKIKLFKRILDEGKDKYTFLIRNRLKIDFQSK
ncbi:hypothetical protein D0817_24710 [Flavobacterium cupreum]|uniref:Uncharacterized protein n=1 Tax=Flavobacterium cupreum TaxID=2133766 RepID=A0A434A073_9FLAO|nr:hypothetical protein [Flavobacterium cupreum]RUT67768.1 hypothetical protein D0817_24710 [Flavobacterium cupreum]